MLFLSQNLNAGNADSQCQQDAKSMCVAEPGMVCCFWYSDSEKFCMVDEYDFKDEDDDEDEGENNDIPR